MKFSLLLLLLPLLFVVSRGRSEDAPQCGPNAGGKQCPRGQCCSRWGFCGETNAYCGVDDCQSQCPISNIISKEQFEEILLNRNDPRCPASGFYTYEAFVEAAKYSPDFGNFGDISTKKREIAAFLAQSSHATTGTWASESDVPYSWGYCFNGRPSSLNYCVPDDRFPCALGKEYYPRGPLQIAFNIIYGEVAEKMGLNILSNPDLVETDPVIAFRSAIGRWMADLSRGPSSHDVIVGKWEPSFVDLIAGRLPGYGLTTNVLTAGVECGKGEPNPSGESRIGFYRRICDILGITYGDNLDCYNQWPFIKSSSGASI